MCSSSHQVNAWVSKLLLFTLVQVLAAQDSQFRVQVLDSLHHSVNPAKVELVSDRDSQTASTDLNGMASFSNLPFGRYKVRVSESGFIVWLRDLDYTAPQERPLLVTLRLGSLGCEPHYWIEYDNGPGPQVRGMVINAESGKGIRGLKIDLRHPGDKKPIITMRSQKKGVFEIPGIAPGRYRLRVTGDTEFADEQVELVVPTDKMFITIRPLRRGFIEICE